ncbi:hypothetical protein QJS04_geneDACA008803 [Acorus gramineus]|uniref:Remorin C-terminal domain-containing protein n=1 Tax=Acorus gramineus TaxID=55184 RepID=A0AAV9ABA9_ACOGR|nr:hypothetical protein QJS04_geneDACA008803 [Acorus gramineus]
MKNKIALIHKEAEEKRAMVEAKRGEELLKAEEERQSTVHRGWLQRSCWGALEANILFQSKLFKDLWRVL